LVAEAT